jgi:hypothetical protein
MADPVKTAEKTKVDNRVQFWLGEIAAARKHEKDFRQEGRRVNDIYSGKKKDSIPFNILYSNTETLIPALYNATPRPVVQRRFKDDDPLGKSTALAGVRTLEFLCDTNSEEYESFDDVIGDAVLDALLPGRGISRVKYDAEIVGEEGARYVKWELVCFESQKWDRVTLGYAKKWSRVPWLAFEHDISQEEAAELFGAAKAAKLTFTEEAKLEDREDSDSGRDDDQNHETRKVAKVWEIWEKRTKKVRYVSPNYAEDFLKEEDDPLELTGFYPIPKPLRFLRKANDQMPTALYLLYENQAKELNRLSIRINRIAEALKVRGAFDSSLGELERILKADDNTLVAAENVAALLDKGGLEKAIWLMPIEKLITVFQQLIVARQQCKQIIYEITGISDILRGSTVASETATAQQIKNQWGTLRLKRMQKDVANYVRDMLRIALEIAAKKFEEKTFASITGLPFTTTKQAQAANAQVAAARSMIAQQAQAAAMQTGQQMPPQMQQQMLQQAVPQALQQLQAPQWAQIMASLKNDTQRMYRIDVETNSTVDVEATEDQKIMGEVLTAISQFMQGVAPLIQSGSMPFQVAQSMLLAIVRRYRFGPEIEDYLKQMKPPVPPDQGKMQAEQAKQQFEMKKAQDEHQLKMAEGDQKLQAEKEKTAMKMEFEREKLGHEREKLRMDKERMVLEHQALIAELNAKVQAAHAMPKKPAGGNGSSHAAS